MRNSSYECANVQWYKFKNKEYKQTLINWQPPEKENKMTKLDEFQSWLSNISLDKLEYHHGAKLKNILNMKLESAISELQSEHQKELQEKDDEYNSDVNNVIEEIQEEIEKQRMKGNYRNIGKFGCIKRLIKVLEKHEYKSFSEIDTNDEVILGEIVTSMKNKDKTKDLEPIEQPKYNYSSNFRTIAELKIDELIYRVNILTEVLKNKKEIL